MVTVFVHLNDEMEPEIDAIKGVSRKWGRDEILFEVDKALAVDFAPDGTPIAGLHRDQLAYMPLTVVQAGQVSKPHPFRAAEWR